MFFPPLFRYSVGSSFERDAAAAMLDLTGDEDQETRKKSNAMKW